MPKTESREVTKRLTLRLTDDEFAAIERFRKRIEDAPKTLTGAIRLIIAMTDTVTSDYQALDNANAEIKDLKEQVKAVRQNAHSTLEITGQKALKLQK